MTLLRRIFSDPLFFRICTLLWGLPFLSTFAIFLASSDRLESWQMGALIISGLIGVFLVGVALLGDDRSVDGAATAASTGTDEIILLLFFLVAVLAVPVTLALRKIWPQKETS